VPVTTVTVNNSTQLVCNVSTVYRQHRPDQLLNYQECRRHASLLENGQCHGSQEYVHVKRIVMHPPTRSSLNITNRSFQYAAPCLWNDLPTDLREPRQTQSPSLSPITHGSSSSSSSPSSRSPLASSLTRSVFHSELKDLALWQIISSIDLFLSYRTDSTDSRIISCFYVLNGWICLHGVLD